MTDDHKKRPTDEDPPRPEPDTLGSEGKSLDPAQRPQPDELQRVLESDHVGEQDNG